MNVPGKIELCESLNIPIIYHHEKTEKTVLKKNAKLTNGQTDRQTKGGFIGPFVQPGSNTFNTNRIQTIYCDFKIKIH